METRELSFGESNGEMLESGTLSDVELEVGLPHCGKLETLAVHKFILVSRSPVFKAMFSHNFTEQDARRVRIGEDISTFKQIIQYLYRGETQITHANVLGLYLMSRKYLVFGLEAACLRHLTSSINDREVFLMLDFLVRYDDPQPVRLCLQFISRRLGYLGHTRSFRELSKAAIVAIVTSDELDVQEEELYVMCVSWARHQLTERREEKPTDGDIRGELDGILTYLRFPTMGTLTFARKVDTSEVLTTEEKCAIYRYMITNKARTIKPTFYSAGVCFPTTPRQPQQLISVDTASPGDSHVTWAEASKLQILNFKVTESVRLAGFSVYDWLDGDPEVDQIVAARSDLRVAREKFDEVTGGNLVADKDLQFINVPGSGKVMYPVYFREQIPLESGVWYSLRVTIRYKPACKTRRTLGISQDIDVEEAKLETKNFTCSVRYFPQTSYNNHLVPCDIIPKLLFSNCS